MLGRSSYDPTIPRWRVWPPSRALQLERGQVAPPEPLSNNPPTFESEIDPQYPVFGNPLTATVRANFAAARNEIERIYERVEALEQLPGLGIIDGGTWE